MSGILKLAYKLLISDTATLVGITFAVFLKMFVTSMFSNLQSSRIREESEAS